MSTSWPIGFTSAFQMGLTGADNARFIARVYDRDEAVNAADVVPAIGSVFVRDLAGIYNANVVGVGRPVILTRREIMEGVVRPAERDDLVGVTHWSTPP